jgi:hypothetical protein
MVLRYDVPPDSSCPAIIVSAFSGDGVVITWLLNNYVLRAMPGHPLLEAIIGSGLRGQREPRPLRSMMRGSPSVLGDQFSAV